MSDTQIAATLTDEQLAEVVALAPVEPIQAIVQAWRFICPNWDTLAPQGLKPWSYSLPRDQWSAICDALTKFPGYGIVGGANLALDWMNKGPSVRDN